MQRSRPWASASARKCTCVHMVSLSCSPAWSAPLCGTAPFHRVASAWHTSGSTRCGTCSDVMSSGERRRVGPYERFYLKASCTRGDGERSERRQLHIRCRSHWMWDRAARDTRPVIRCVHKVCRKRRVETYSIPVFLFLNPPSHRFLSLAGSITTEIVTGWSVSGVCGRVIGV